MTKRLRLRDSGGGTSPSVIVAVAGVALSVAVMILTVAVVIGFKREITRKVMGFEAQLTVTPSERYAGEELVSGSTVAPDVLGFVKEQMPMARVDMSITRQGVLKTDDDFAGVRFTAFDSSHDWEFIESHIVEGELPDFASPNSANDIVVSRAIASRLNIELGDKIDTYFFSDGNIRARKFRIAAIYDTYFSDYDNLQCFAAMPTIGKIAGLSPGQADAIGIRGIPEACVEAEAQSLETALYNRYISRIDKADNELYKVESISSVGAAYINWLRLLDTNVVVILALMGLVAAFTLVSCLFTIVLERVSLIGTLKSLGATNSQVVKVFALLSARVAGWGIVIGNVIGIGFAVLQKYTNIVPLDPEAYFLTSVPIHLQWPMVLLVDVGVTVLAALTLLVPSRMISGISPAATMRFD